MIENQTCKYEITGESILGPVFTSTCDAEIIELLGQGWKYCPFCGLEIQLEEEKNETF